jgi:NAD-dependent DNA ligase
VEIGAKGIGETTVEKIYDQGHTAIGDFINLEEDQVSFLGPVASRKLIKSINEAMSSITIPKLMAGSKVFGRGLGAKRFSWILKGPAGPDFVTDRMTRDQYISLFMSIDGFAKKTAEQAADGMEEFWNFVDNEIPTDIYVSIIDNTIKLCGTGSEKKKAHPDIMGKKICLTGFRDAKISDFIESNGGKIQGSCNESTDILVRRDGYSNKKTEFAESHSNIRVIDKSEFIGEFSVYA